MSEGKGITNNFFHKVRKLQREQKWEEAIALYRKAIEANPNFAWSYFLLAEVLAQQGRLEEAKHNFQEAIKLNPTNQIYQQRMSSVLNTASHLSASQEKPLITVFGSCRVHNPMITLVSQKRYIRFNNKLLAFSHNTHEIVQQISFIQNSTILPDELIPFIVSPPDFYNYLELPVFVDNELEKTSVFFVEITSWKYALYDNYYFDNSAWSMFEIFKDRFNYSQSIIDSYNKFKNQVEFGVQDSESLIEGMKLIKQMLPGKVVFVTHCDVPIPSTGEPIISRQKLINAVSENARSLYLPLLNPTYYIKEFENKHNKPAMRDTNHYTPAFNSFLAHCMYQDFIK